MYDEETVKAALKLGELGANHSQIARLLGVSRFSARSWLNGQIPVPRPCPLDDFEGLNCANYAYLLGLYLGDGCISVNKKGVARLRIVCTRSYTHLLQLCETAMFVALDRTVGFTTYAGHVEVYSDSKHWPCLFPQHGKGPKHLRKIELVDWQLEIVREYPWELIRGLIHSDGCRDLNPVNGKDYVRYSFCNMSQDIKDIFTDALDQVGVHWTKASSRIISIARRPSVALMEEHVGPKS